MNYSGEISSLADLNKVAEYSQVNEIKMSGCFQYYRGHGSYNHKLNSYISRLLCNTNELRKTEIALIKALKQKMKTAEMQDYFFVPKIHNSFDENWYWLTQAQHLGIPTRLLDWTLSREVALYFAVSNKAYEKINGDFWIFFIPDTLNIYNQEISLSSISPFESDKDLFISIPTNWNKNYERNESQRNIVSQQGKFFMRTLSNCLQPLEADEFYKKYLLRFKISASKKTSLLEELTALNYTKDTIYKTIDTTAKAIKEELLETFNMKKCSI